MEYELKVSNGGNYLIVTHKGNVTGEIALKAVLESHTLAREHGILCILVDAIEARYFESKMEKYYATVYERFKNQQIDRRTCVALLVDPDDYSHDSMETLMRIIGHNVTLFRNREKAIKHLKSSGKYDKLRSLVD